MQRQDKKKKQKRKKEEKKMGRNYGNFQTQLNIVNALSMYSFPGLDCRAVSPFVNVL